MLPKWPKIDEVEGKLVGAWQMRAGCDPETRKRISRLRLNRLSSGLALRGLVISFLPAPAPRRGFFPSRILLPFGRTADKSLLAVSRVLIERAQAAGDAGRHTTVLRRRETVRAAARATPSPAFNVTASDTAYLCAGAGSAPPRQFVFHFTFLSLSLSLPGTRPGRRVSER